MHECEMQGTFAVKVLFGRMDMTEIGIERYSVKGVARTVSACSVHPQGFESYF